MNSNLPVEILGKIWEFADHNKDGCLDSEEFAVVRKGTPIVPPHPWIHAKKTVHAVKCSFICSFI